MELNALAGRWHTTGQTTDDPPITVDATDEYEEVPGGALLHRIDARMGNEHVEGAELIGFDPALGRFRTHYFGTGGPSSYEAELSRDNGALVWSMRNEKERFRGTFSADGNAITGQWERLTDAGAWERWMDITLTREPHRRL